MGVVVSEILKFMNSKILKFHISKIMKVQDLETLRFQNPESSKFCNVDSMTFYDSGLRIFLIQKLFDSKIVRRRWCENLQIYDNGSITGTSKAQNGNITQTQIWPKSPFSQYFRRAILSFRSLLCTIFDYKWQQFLSSRHFRKNLEKLPTFRNFRNLWNFKIL